MIETYFFVFVNQNQNDEVKPIFTAKFVYNNRKNMSISYILFELNSNYDFYIFFENDINPYSKSCSVDRLIDELRDLMLICQ